jgi:hypothetical protein
MTKAVSNVSIATDTFNGWLTQTNVLLDTLTNEIVTANTLANGSLTTGNAFVNGIFGANTVVVPSSLRGGNVQSSNVLNITSATLISGNVSVNTTSNTFVVNSTTTFSVQTSNSYTNATNITLTGNTVTIPANTVTFTANTITVDSANINSNLQIRTDLGIFVVANTDLGSNTTSPLEVFAFTKAGYSSGKITAQSKKGSNTQINECVVAHDTTTNAAQLTVYGTVQVPVSANLGVYSATTNATHVSIRFKQTNQNTAVKVVAHLIK